MGDEFVTQMECSNRREKIDARLNEHDMKFIKLDTTLEAMLSISKMIFGALAGGMVTIIIILLTRGI